MGQKLRVRILADNIRQRGILEILLAVAASQGALQRCPSVRGSLDKRAIGRENTSQPMKPQG